MKIKTILFVDDEKNRFNLFCRNLDKDDNLRLWWVDNVTKAKNILESFNDNISLIMLDNDLGEGLDGVALTRWIIENNIQRNSVFVVHSMNPIANRRIFNYLNSADYEVYSLPGSWYNFTTDGFGNVKYSIV